MAFGDMIAAGQIYSSDMRQLVSRGIDAWAILASKMGKSVSQIKKMAKDGALESKKSVELILEGMGELFPNMMEEQSKAFDGLASTIKDNMQQISSALSSPIFEIAKGNMGKLAYATGYFLDVLKQTGSRIEAFRATMYLAFGQNGVNAVNLFVFGITKAFEFIQFAISSLVTWWQSLDPSIQNTIMIIGGVIIVGTAVAAVIMGLVSIVSALAAAFSFLWGPIGLIIGAIALLAGAIYWLWTTDEGFRNTMINGWNQIYNTIVSIITNLVPIMQEAWKVIVIIFGAAWENICQIIKTAAIFITNLVQSILTVFDGLLMILSGVFTGNWKKVWDGCGKIFEGAWNSILNLAGLVVNQIIGLINDVIRGINALKNKAALIPGVPKLGDIKTLDTVNWGQSARYNNASGGGENPLSLNIGDLFKNLFKDYTPPKLEVATVDYSKPGDIIRDIAEAGDAQEKAAKQGKKAGNEQAKTLDKVTKEIEKFVDAVQKQAESIINFADLFEKAMLKKFSSTKLLNALKTQLDYLLKWRDALAVLGDRIGTNTALYQTLLKKGPEAAGQIIALSGATDKVLSEYQVAYGQLETIGYDMGYVMAANEQAQNYRNQQIAVNVTGNTISNDYEVDRIADQIIRKLRLQGVY
jgi:tape measure domain-containing protein